MSIYRPPPHFSQSLTAVGYFQAVSTKRICPYFTLQEDISAIHIAYIFLTPLIVQLDEIEERNRLLGAKYYPPSHR